MSSFIVVPECINCIVTHLRQDADLSDWLRENIGFDLAQAGNLDKLADDLYRLNCDASELLWSDDPENPSEPTAFKFNAESCDLFEVYEAVDCLLYQCSEGDIVERPLYRMLALLFDKLAHKVTAQLGRTIQSRFSPFMKHPPA